MAISTRLSLLIKNAYYFLSIMNIPSARVFEINK